MYNISLLPSEYRMLHQASKKKDKGLMISIIVMLGLFALYLGLTLAMAAKGRELDSIRNTNRIVENRISGIGELIALKNEAKSLSDMASKAYGKNPEWDSLLAEISNTVPENIGLTSIQLSYSDGKGNCIVQGVSLNHQGVTDWIKALEELNKTGEVMCNYAQETQGQVEFEISFALLPGEGFVFEEVAASE